MKKLIILIVTASLSVGAMLMFSQSAEATSFTSSSESSVAKSEVIDGSYYSASNKLSIQGTVDGDVYCAGSSVSISGTVNGDVLCAAQDIEIDGVVNGDVRVAAQSVNLSGEVKGSLNALAATVTANEDFKLTGDATVMAATADIGGTIGRDAVISAATVNLRGSIARDVTLQTESVTFGDDSQVKGNLDYTHQQTLEINQAHVEGEITHHQPPANSYQTDTTINTVIGSILMMVAMVVLYPLFMPNLARKINQHGRKDMVYTFLVGVAAVILTPIVAVISLVTVVGAPLGLVLFMALGIAILVGLAQAASLLGYYMLNKSTDNTLLQTLGGGLILAIALQIPILGVLVAIAWLFIGTGLVAYYSGKQLLERPVYKSK